MSWLEAAKFVNWLNTSTSGQAAYKFDGSGNFQLWVPGDPGYDATNLFRNSLALYVLPSMDEWYKAAYYDPISGSYFNYPTGSDTFPTAVASGTAVDTAVYLQGVNQGPADIMLAGGLSKFGTMGQGGNVFEWEETEFDLLNNSGSSARGFRGASWINGLSNLASSDRFDNLPANEDPLTGFRVASLSSPANVVPEPGSLAVWGLIGLCGLLYCGRRGRK